MLAGDRGSMSSGRSAGMELTTWFTLLFAMVVIAICAIVIGPVLFVVGLAVAAYRAIAALFGRGGR